MKEIKVIPLHHVNCGLHFMYLIMNCPFLHLGMQLYPDFLRTAKEVLRDFRFGTLGKINLDANIIEETIKQKEKEEAPS